MVVDEHLVDGERDVVLGLETNDVVDLLGRHLGNLDLLDDELAAADGDDRVGALDAGLLHRFLDGVGHRRGVVDGPVGDRVGDQGDHAEPSQGVVADLDYLDGARANVQTEALTLFTEDPV